MKALVLAGGSGTRLRPLTHTGAKQLVPVANRPVLFYVLDNLVDAGITDIGIIISPETGSEIKAALGDGHHWGAQLTFLVQDRPAGLAHAVAIARPFLGDAPFVMYLGDNLIGMKIRSMISSFQNNENLVASILLKEVANPSAFGVAEVDGNDTVIRLVEKPILPQSNLALVGVYLFRSAIFDAIENVSPSPRGELEITDAISKLIEQRKSVQCTRLTSWWLDTGKKDDMLLANDTVLDDWLTSEMLGHVDAESKLSGRIRIGQGTTIERCTIRGPVAIGANVRLVDSRIGPFTSIGDNVQVERSTVEHSILMVGSRIIDIARLEDSLVGRRVLVRPGSPHHGSLSLMVGDDCVIEMSKR